MSEKLSNFNRRDILKGTGVAAGLGTATGLSTATDSIDPDEARERALQSEYVRSILDELDQPTIANVTAKKLTQEYETGRLAVTAIDLETKLGTITYTESSGESTAMFQFDTDTWKGQPSRALPDKYRLDHDVEAMLTIDADVGVVFLRTATPSEQQHLARKTGLDPADAAMFFNSKIGGFEVHPLPEDDRLKPHATDEREAFLVKPTQPVSGAEVTTQPSQLAEMQTERVLTPQAGCTAWARDCMLAITWCSLCVMACASIPITNVKGAVACVTCVMSGCGIATPYACHKLVDNCS
jgi:hypothetical protein